MRRGMMPIRLTFLLVIGVIAAFLIIGMLIDWAFNAGKMMDRITKGEESLPDNQKIDATGENCEQVLIKYAKLCYAKVTQEQMPAGLCYAVDSCSVGWTATSNDNIFNEISNAFGPFDPPMYTAQEKQDMEDDIKFSGSGKAVIKYEGHLVIE